MPYKTNLTKQQINILLLSHEKMKLINDIITIQNISVIAELRSLLNNSKHLEQRD